MTEPSPTTAEPRGRRRFLGELAAGTLGVALGSAGLVGCSGGGDGQAGSDAAAAGTTVATGGGATAAAGATGAEPEVSWSLPSSWSRSLPTLWAGTEYFAARVRDLTGGRFVLTPAEPGDPAVAGQVGALDVFDTVRGGTHPAGTTASYYYSDQNPIMAFGTAVPFGLTSRQHLAWLHSGGGLELLQGIYARQFNVIQFPVATTGAQMGGWFNREITATTDLQGLRMRIPGLGGQVLAALGVEPVNLAAGELVGALQAGTIDAAEFIGPEDDQGLGLQNQARFYYYPGFWEPNATLEVLVNLDAWQQLPPPFQEAFRSAAAEATMWTQALYDARNGQALNDLVAGGVQLRAFPDEVLDAAQAATSILLDQLAVADGDVATVLEHWRAFRRQVAPWFSLAEAALLR